jgi:hypothetical protein
VGVLEVSAFVAQAVRGIKDYRVPRRTDEVGTEILAAAVDKRGSV